MRTMQKPAPSTFSIGSNRHPGLVRIPQIGDAEETFIAKL